MRPEEKMAQERMAQEKMIERIRRVCREDDRLEAAMFYGSFALMEADPYSDIDVILYFDEEAVTAIDRRAWLEQIAPVELLYVNEFGTSVAIFSSLVRGEFHFDPVNAMSHLESYRGRISFPSLEAVILVDKSGRLSQRIEPLIGPPPVHDSGEEAGYLSDSFLNWYLFGRNLLTRGEFARSLEVMQLIHDNLLRMARLDEGRTERWITPTRSLERELSPAAYRRFQACTAPLEPEAIRVAYQAAWEWGGELMSRLARRFELTLPAGLLEKLARLQ